MYLTIRTNIKYKQKLKQYADKNNMSMTAYIKMALNNQIKKEKMQEAKTKILSMPNVASCLDKDED